MNQALEKKLNGVESDILTALDELEKKIVDIKTRLIRIETKIDDIYHKLEIDKDKEDFARVIREGLLEE